MSGKTTGKVWDLDLPPAQQIVLLALADKADQNGENIHPGLRLVAWMTGYSERQVRRIVRQLETLGILESMDETKPGKATIYRIEFSKAELKQPFEKQSTPDTAKSVVPRTRLSHPGQDVRPGHRKATNIASTPDMASAKTASNGNTNGIKDKEIESSAPSKSKTIRHDYDDVPQQDRLEIIRAWADSLTAPPIGVYKKDDNHRVAAEIFRAGYRAHQVGLFVKAKKMDGWWKDKTLSLTKVAELMPEWLLSRTPSTTFTPVDDGLIPDDWAVDSFLRKPVAQDSAQ